MRLAVVRLVALWLIASPLLAQQSPTSVPAKIALAPVNLQNRMGEPVSVNLQLLDANGHPVSAIANVNAEVKVQSPSGQTESYPVTFAAGESTKQVPLSIPESGVAKLTVKQNEQRLIGGSAFVLVRPEGKSHMEVPKTGAKKKPAGKGPSARVLRYSQPHLVYASLTFAEPEPQGPASSDPPSGPQLQLAVSGEDVNGGTRADGQTCARVQVFYLGTDELQRDVQVWLSFSNGDIDNNPIVIRKGTAVGEACWRSQYPIPAASLQVAATSPANVAFVPTNPGADPKRVTHKFTDNIRGIAFRNPPASITIVDIFKLTAGFTGPDGQPVKVTDQRSIHFTTDSAVLQLSPLETIVEVGNFDSSTVLVPTFFGKSIVQASTPDYPIASQPITITWLGVLLVCLTGGLVGGLLAWINSQGKLWVRIVTGVIVGLVASWAYVVVGLPKVSSQFLHNELSVFFVSLLFAVGGVKGLATISSALNFPSF